MIHIDQHTDTRPGVKTVALVLAFGGAAILAGIVLGWGISKASSGFKPASFYMLSNLASAIESFSQRFAPGTELVVQPERKTNDASVLLVPSVSAVEPSEEGGPDEAPHMMPSNSAPATVILPKQTPPASSKKNPLPSTSTRAAASPTPQAGVKTEKTFVYYSTGPTTGDPSGTIDLEPHILDIGVVDRNTNVFTSSSSPSVASRVAVRFDVVNKGTKTSGAWSANVVLPTYPFYIYSGDSQLPLKPGERIEFIIGFDSIEPKANAEVIVNVDPTGSVVESNESNNIIKTVIHPVF